MINKIIKFYNSWKESMLHQLSEKFKYSPEQYNFALKYFNIFVIIAILLGLLYIYISGGLKRKDRTINKDIIEDNDSTDEELSDSTDES